MGNVLQFVAGPLPGPVLPASYEPGLVVASYVVASLAAYTAIDLAGRVIVYREDKRRAAAWLAGGAFAMGAGIWSMHFVAMLAYELPIPVRYEPWTTLASMVAAIVTSGFALYIVTRGRLSWLRLLVSGIIMGAGIATMHYTGMAAMRLDALVMYYLAPWLLSIVNAIVCSTIAIWLVFRLGGSANLATKVAAALVMGVAICGMHYTGMYATVCISTAGSVPTSGLDPAPIAAAIAAVTLLIMTVALTISLEDRVAERTARLEESNVQLQSSNLAKSNFLSMMSHEIRTPMNGVLGMLELLSLSRLDDDQRRTLDIVRQSGRSLLRIIDDILDFSKIEAGKLAILPEAVSIGKIVASVVGIYSGNASSKGLALLSEVDPRISPAVLVDPLRLQQILNNLVDNAIKFTTRGRVEIKAELIERGDGEDMVRISVVDTGVGISKEERATLFQPFTQAGRGNTRTFGGTGLGLSIAQRLAAMMGGSMALESEPGRGTSAILTLRLPIVGAPSQGVGGKVEQEAAERLVRGQREVPALTEAEREGTLVLVVDDHPINRLVLMRQVGILGYAHEAAENGSEALEMWKSSRYGLVLTDCNMPVMDGYELARRIRALEREMGKRRTPIVACTANALKGEAENCFEAGMDDYIAKPVELQRLRQALDKWLPIPPGDGGPAPREAARGVTGAPPPLDRAAFAEASGGDVRVEQAIAAKFLEENVADAALVARALEARDAQLLVHAAHRVKGASRTIGAVPMAEASARLEAAARARDWSAIEESEPEFRAEAERLAGYLAAMTGQGGGS